MQDTYQTDVKADELEMVIEVLDTLFEQGEPCINPITKLLVTDTQYDALRTELRGIRPDSYVFDTTTASQVESGTKKVKHDPPMTSISKANGTLDEKNVILTKWIKDCSDELNYNLKSNSKDNPFFVTSYKRDGVALSLYYKDGKLISAGLRPRDGVNGEDVTANAIHVKGIPERLSVKVTCCIRGELECLKSVFDKMNKKLEKNGEKTFANPRNFTAGSIRQFKDPTVTRQRKLSFTAYSIENFDNPPYKTEIERAKWCCKTLEIPFVYLKGFHYSNLAKMEKESSDLDYEIDGAVLSVNNLEDSEQLGKHGNSITGNPKGKIAWKFSERSAIVEVNNIRWQTGRTGRITPVLEFDGVKLDGTTVSQCTAHNVGIVKTEGMGIGAKVRIIKSGKIIPKVISVDKRSKNIIVPINCPSCGSILCERQGNKALDLVCKNKETCPAQNVQNLVHYLTNFGVKGLAGTVTEKLLKANLISSPADFYRLEVADLTAIDIGERTAILTVARIHMVNNPEKCKNNKTLLNKIRVARQKKKSIPLAQFISCFGIIGAGKGTARTLVDHFSDFDAIRSASVKELEDVADIGMITAKLLFEYFAKNKDMIDSLLESVELEIPKTGEFTGMKFVFTGSFPNGKRYWQRLVEDEGGKIGSSVSRKTDFCVVGQDPGSKEKKATELGIKKIDIDELQQLLN